MLLLNRRNELLMKRCKPEVVYLLVPLRDFCESDSREFRNSFLGALTRLWFVLCSFIAASFKLCRKRSAPSSPCSCVRGVSVTSDWDLYRLVRLSKSEFRVSKIPLKIGPRSSRDASSSLDGISWNARRSWRSWWSDIELKHSSQVQVAVLSKGVNIRTWDTKYRANRYSTRRFQLCTAVKNEPRW